MYVNVWLPEIFGTAFSYHVPEEFREKIQFGIRVTIPFKNKLTFAIVEEILEEIPAYDLIKDIVDIPENDPIIYPKQFAFWKWMADYYMVSTGVVMRYALPKAFALKSETMLYYNPNFSKENIKISDDELLLLDALELQDSLKIQEVKAILPHRKNPNTLVSRMVKKDMILLEKFFEEKYRYKTIKKIRITDTFLREKEKHYQTIKRAKKQMELLQFLETCPDYTAEFKDIFVENGLSKFSAKALQKKHFVMIFEEKIERKVFFETIERDFANKYQEAENKINHWDWEDKNQAVFYYEQDFYQKLAIYKKAIQKKLAEDKDVLLLIPEILLFPQYYAFLQHFFEDQVLVYNARLSDHERVDTWRKVYHHENRKAKVIVSAKEGIMLPFDNLGLIIVDSSSDLLYKQHLNQPLYNAKDMAFVLMKMYDCQLLMSAIVPSVETYYLIEKKMVEVLKFEKKQTNLHIKLVDVHHEKQHQGMVQHLSKNLIYEIDEALVNKKQVLIYKDRRGYASKMECQSCDYTPSCVRCSVHLTFHKREYSLRCHQCGYSTRPSFYCAKCEKPDMQVKGYGTERIYEELKGIFDKSVIVRLDKDTLKGKNKLNQFIDRYDNGEIDILIGTKMISKGVDLSNTALFAVVSMDDMLHYPDFRGEERAIQTIQSVGKRLQSQSPDSLMILQTYQPKHPVNKMLQENQEITFLHNKFLLDRKKYSLPPYTRMIGILFRHKHPKILEDGTRLFKDTLSAKISQKYLIGPFPAHIEKLNNYYQEQMIIQLPRNKNLVKTKRFISKVIERFGKHKDYRNILISVDVDPQYL
ncbi:MAG: primosomal protein N' [Flavobacteriales bacterium]|jgi:primosomal protein N' (replication factor Y)|nr:primosomal protein N' [Flavobacteriales bacterium]